MVAKAPKPVKEKPVKTKSKPVGLTTTVIGRDRPPEQIPLIVTGVVAILGGGALYALSVSSEGQFNKLAEWKVGADNPVNNDPTSRQTLIKKQQSANRLFLSSFVVMAAGASTLSSLRTVLACLGRQCPVS